MISIRTSTLEQFRRCVETDFGDEKDLRERIIRGQWSQGPTNWQMDAGTAWHRALAWQEPDEEDEGAFRHGDYWFSSAQIGKAREKIGPGVNEVTARKLIRNIGDVEVGGTADHLRGLLIQDNKTKFSAIDPRDYEKSLQWRIYLLLHDAECFRYNLFDFRDPKKGYCELVDIVSFNFWRYERLEQECTDWVVRFLDWIDAAGLTNALQSRVAA
jgi:hypothetical protein